MDDAIAELEGMRRAAEADEATTVQMRKRLVGLQGTLRKSRQAPKACQWHCPSCQPSLVVHVRMRNSRLQLLALCRCAASGVVSR